MGQNCVCLTPNHSPFRGALSPLLRLFHRSRFETERLN